jgi:branched-chain amino acid transport system ATP-binding protein
MTPRLQLDHVTTGYGRVEVLHDLNITVPAGSVVALLGPNGAGKTTALRAISGTLPVWRGRIALDGRRLNGLSPFSIARRGVTLIPEGRGIFPALNVRENLQIAVHADRTADDRQRHQKLEDLLDTFPRLRERLHQRAGTLSGGEQQMLAMSRAFLSSPQLLLMDEISMGLAPRIVDQLFASAATLKAHGLTMMLVEQYLTYALRLADIVYVMAKGRVAFVGEPGELRTGGSLAGYVGA